MKKLMLVLCVFALLCVCAPAKFMLNAVIPAVPITLVDPLWEDANDWPDKVLIYVPDNGAKISIKLVRTNGGAELLAKVAEDGLRQQGLYLFSQHEASKNGVVSFRFLVNDYMLGKFAAWPCRFGSSGGYYMATGFWPQELNTKLEKDFDEFVVLLNEAK